MRRPVYLLAVLILLGWPALLCAQAPVIGPTDALAFDYPDQDYTESQVDRFEAAYDGSAFAALAAPKYQTVNGVSSYKFIPPQTAGTHTVALRACNPIGCGAASSPFVFALATTSPPTAVPGNVRKVIR